MYMYNVYVKSLNDKLNNILIYRVRQRGNDCSKISFEIKGC